MLKGLIFSLWLVFFKCFRKNLVLDIFIDALKIYDLGPGDDKKVKFMLHDPTGHEIDKSNTNYSFNEITVYFLITYTFLAQMFKN